MSISDLYNDLRWKRNILESRLLELIESYEAVKGIPGNKIEGNFNHPMDDFTVEGVVLNKKKLISILRDRIEEVRDSIVKVDKDLSETNRVIDEIWEYGVD